LAYTSGAHVIVENPDFVADAKAAGVKDDEMRRTIDYPGVPTRVSSQAREARVRLVSLGAAKARAEVIG
jgi:hypothetical protein